MEKTVFESKDSLVPGRPLKIMERTETGKFLMEWLGFYDPDKNVVILYPKYNPYAARNEKGKKKIISDLLVRVVK